MKYCALIVAAGLSSRMKQFKPLMEIHGMSMAQRIISTFQQAGIREIVMVTGFRARELEAEIKRLGIVCIHNAEYENTEMFDSVKLGLQYLRDKCDAVFFSPVDVPLFTLDTVMKIKNCQEGSIRVPICDGKNGHPVYMDVSVIGSILNYDGNCGLRGAINQNSEHIKRIAVEDQGIFMDADTREDFEQLIRLHDEQLIHPQIKVRLIKKKPFFGPGTAMLLRQIDYTKSVTEASRQLGISYSKARAMIYQLENELERTIVVRQQGGKHGGTASLTKEGICFLEKFERYELELEKFAIEKYREIFSFF